MVGVLQGGVRSGQAPVPVRGRDLWDSPEEGLSLRGGAVLFVIPAHAGIHVFCLCFLFSDWFPPMTGR